MIPPIYSNDKIINDEKVKKNIIILLSDETIKELNNKLTFTDHGIYIFSQYKEKRYIINGYAETIFWNMISRLYVLLHDCGLNVLPFFLEIVQSDGKQSIKPYPVTSNDDKIQFEKAIKFVEDIKILRHSEQHNMKPDSNVDEGKIRKRKKIFCKISRKEATETELDWEKCIQWIVSNCTNLYCLLSKRLDYLEEEATQLQRELLVAGYYRCLSEYYNKTLNSVIAEVLRKRRRIYTESYIIASTKKYEKQIIEKAIDLLKNSPIRVDPYKVILQAVDLCIE